MSAPDVLAMSLRLICSHDSRSVEGCVTCEAADQLEELSTSLAKLIKASIRAERLLRDMAEAGFGDLAQADELRAALALARVGGDQ